RGFPGCRTIRSWPPRGSRRRRFAGLDAPVPKLFCNFRSAGGSRPGSRVTVERHLVQSTPPATWRRAWRVSARQTRPPLSADPRCERAVFSSHDHASSINVYLAEPIPSAPAGNSPTLDLSTGPGRLAAAGSPPYLSGLAGARPEIVL